MNSILWKLIIDIEFNKYIDCKNKECRRNKELHIRVSVEFVLEHIVHSFIHSVEVLETAIIHSNLQETHLLLMLK